MPGPVGGLRKHPHGRVDQLEDRYLGMVEAPSSNLGTSTRNHSQQVCWTCATNLQRSISVKFVGSARPPETIHNKSVGRAPRLKISQIPQSLARHVHHSIDSFCPSISARPTHGPIRSVRCTKAIRRVITDFTATTALRRVTTVASTSHQWHTATITQTTHG